MSVSVIRRFAIATLLLSLALSGCTGSSEFAAPSVMASSSSSSLAPTSTPSPSPSTTLEAELNAAMAEYARSSRDPVKVSGSGAAQQAASARKRLKVQSEALSALAENLSKIVDHHPEAQSALNDSIQKLSGLATEAKRASALRSQREVLLKYLTAGLLNAPCRLLDIAGAIEALGGQSVRETIASLDEDQAVSLETVDERRHLCSAAFKKGFPKLIARDQVRKTAPGYFETWVLERDTRAGILIAISPTLYVPWGLRYQPWQEIQEGPWFGKCDEYFKWSPILQHQPRGDDGSCW